MPRITVDYLLGIPLLHKHTFDDISGLGSMAQEDQALYYQSDQIDSFLAERVFKAGDTMTGALEIQTTASQLTLAYDAANKAVLATSSTGALNITPKAGQDLDIFLSTTGDFTVNTNQLYLDTSTGFFGVGAVPSNYKTELTHSSTNVLGIINTSSSSIGSGAGIVGLLNSLPTAAGHRLGFYTFGANDNGTHRNQALIQGMAAEAWVTGTNAGTYMEFAVTPVGSTTRFVGMKLDSNGSLGINTTSFSDRLELVDGTSGASSNTTYNGITVHAAANAGLQLLSPNTSNGVITFGDPEDNDIGRILYRHSTNRLDFETNTALAMTIASTGYVGIGTATPDALFTVSKTLTPTAGGVFYGVNLNIGVNGYSDGTTSARSIRYSVVGAGTYNMSDIAGFVGDVYNSLSGGATSINTAGFGVNLRFNTAGSSQIGYGFSTVPLLTSSGSITTEYRAFWARTPSCTSTGTIVQAVGLKIDAQKATGVTAAYGVKQDGASDLNYFAGNVGIGETTPTAKLQVEQTSTTAAIPTLRLQQLDLSEEFIRFDSTVGAGNPIDTAALGAYYGKVRVYIEGVGAKWLPLYD